MAENRAFELEHDGRIHRATDYEVLLKWAEELRISGSDRFRPAGSDDWKPVTDDPQLAALLSPENLWRVKMSSGEFIAGSFEVIAGWARQGRLSTDAVIEGPKTPPGGVMASALPAVSGHLKETGVRNSDMPRLRIDGREYPSPDVETISRWISESRVPVEAEISLAGGPWEPVASCGLFDLENWPQSALGEVEEPSEEFSAQAPPEVLPEPSEPTPPLFSEVEPPEPTEPGSAGPLSPEERDDPETGAGAEEPDPDSNHPAEAFRAISATGIEYEFEDPKEILTLLRRHRVMQYDEVRHSSLPGGSTSAGALADLMRRGRRPGTWWRLAGAVLLASAAVYLADTLGWISIPWLP